MIAALINLIIYLIVLGILVGLAMWVNDQLLQPPAHKFARIVIIAIACIICVLLLLQLVGGGMNLPKLVG